MRKIEQAMVEWLDKKLAENGLAQQAIKDKVPRVVFICAAEACVGIREKGGNNRGPMVELIQETIGGADAEAWCMSFVQTCIAYAELKTGVKSPIAAGEHCLTVWGETPKAQRVKIAPARGAIIIWKHGSGPSGHTGLFLENVNSREFYAVEGNTESGLSKDGSINRDGGGVYRTKRNLVRNGNMSVVGFLKPF